jgi:D-alanyl-D-alanine carboxypeptidase
MMSGRMRVSPMLLALVLAGCAASVPDAPKGAVEAPSSWPSPGASTSPAPAAATSKAHGVAPQEVDAALPRWGVERIDPEMRGLLVGRNWHPGCPVGLHDLRLVTVRYLGFDGETHAGPLILNERVADDVLWVFRRLYRREFPIKRVALAAKWHPLRRRDWFDTHDVTASFNCRPVTNGTSFSEHAYGWAVDVNPLQNPYVNADGVLRRAAKAFVDRSQDVPGMIHPGDVVVRSFARIGWSWGGDWQSLKDYMHFSLTGR